MSTITNTCIESQFLESSKVLKLKVSATNRDHEFNNQLKIKNISTNTEYGGGKSFLQYLTNISSSSPKEVLDKENVYTHTLSKSSSSRLSEKSLQICTENLGCETGSFMMFDSNILSMSSNSSRKEPEEKVVSERKMEGSYPNSYSIKKAKSFGAFPPPLTTMCGEKALQIRSVREGGRLITKAVEIPSQEPCFVADRSEGRLRLRLFNDFETNVDDVQVTPPVEVSPPEEVPEEDEDEEENETVVNTEESRNKEVNDDNDDDDDDDDDEKCKLVMCKEVVNYDVEVENNIGKEKFRRFVRCKECNKGLSKNWEPMWVATS